MSSRSLLYTQCCFAWAGGLLIFVSALHAAPDPDLFDGRIMAPPPAEPSEPSVSDGASGETEQSAGEGSEEASSGSRDFSEIDGVTAGEAVGGEYSKTGEPTSSSGGGRDFSSVGEVGGGESVESASSKSGATTPSGGSGGVTPMDGGAIGGSGRGAGVPTEAVTSGGGSGSGTPTERNFEDFGFGATSGPNSTVDVNDSKTASVPLPLGGSTTASVPSETSVPSSSGEAGGSQPATNVGSGDYGSNLPSGL